MDQITDTQLEQLGNQVFGEKRKKKKISPLVILVLLGAIATTVISVISIRKTESELGFEPNNNIPQVIKQNYDEFLKGK